MKLATVVFASILLSTSSAAFGAETNSFNVFLWGKKSATTTYTLDRSKAGTKVTSRIERQDNPLKTEFRVGPDGLMISGSIARTNDQIITFYTPNKPHDKMDVVVNKNGDMQSPSVWTLTRPDFLIAVMADPATWQLLMDAATAHTHADSIYMLLLPGENNWTPDHIESGHLAAPVAAKGTLDGKQIELRHFVLTLPKGAAHLYADADGRLMLADLGPYGYKNVRANFTLEN
jgi:hypothetical protein